MNMSKLSTLQMQQQYAREAMAQSNEVIKNSHHVNAEVSRLDGMLEAVNKQAEIDKTPFEGEELEAAIQSTYNHASFRQIQTKLLARELLEKFPGCNVMVAITYRGVPVEVSHFDWHLATLCHQVCEHQTMAARVLANPKIDFEAIFVHYGKFEITVERIAELFRADIAATPRQDLVAYSRDKVQAIAYAGITVPQGLGGNIGGGHVGGPGESIGGYVKDSTSNAPEGIQYTSGTATVATVLEGTDVGKKG